VVVDHAWCQKSTASQKRSSQRLCISAIRAWTPGNHGDGGCRETPHNWGHRVGGGSYERGMELCNQIVSNPHVVDISMLWVVIHRYLLSGFWWPGPPTNPPQSGLHCSLISCFYKWGLPWFALI
jgi:hypothetical protein